MKISGTEICRFLNIRNVKPLCSFWDTSETVLYQEVSHFLSCYTPHTDLSDVRPLRLVLLHRRGGRYFYESCTLFPILSFSGSAGGHSGTVLKNNRVLEQLPDDILFPQSSQADDFTVVARLTHGTAFR